MDQPAAQQTSTAIFAAAGSARQRLVRAAVAGGVALLASWLIALALGVLGGFDPLPGLPDLRSQGSTAASSQAQRPQAGDSQDRQIPSLRSKPGLRASDPEPSGGSNETQSPSSPPRIRAPKVGSAPKVTQAPSGSASTASTTRGKAIGTTKEPGKPVGSPGNGPGGSGAPGQLR
jgi:hypothetical protein